MTYSDFSAGVTKGGALPLPCAVSWLKEPHNPTPQAAGRARDPPRLPGRSVRGYVVLETRALDEAVFVVTTREVTIDEGRAWLGIAGIATVDR